MVALNLVRKLSILTGALVAGEAIALLVGMRWLSRAGNTWISVKNDVFQQFITGEMPLPVFVGINVVLYAFCVATLLLAARGAPGAVPMAWIFAFTQSSNWLCASFTQTGYTICVEQKS